MIDSLSDLIQYLNFAKKWFIQYSIQYCFPQNSIQNIIELKKIAGSIQKIFQINSQGIIDTGRIGKVPKNCPISVQNKQKRGLFMKNNKNIGSKYDSFILFTIEFNSKDYWISIFFRNIQFKNYSITFFPGKYNSKIYSKNLIWLDSIQ